MNSAESFETLKLIFNYFTMTISNIMGYYLDSIAGFRAYLKETEQRQYIATHNPRLSIPEIDKQFIIHADGDPDDPNVFIYHVCSLKNLKDRLKDGGMNEILTKQFCLIMIYEYWEGFIRQKLEKTLKVKDAIKADIFGDIRHIRHDIIHNRGYATKEHCEKTKILTWFKEGDLIDINKDKFCIMIEKILEFRNEFMKNKTGQEVYDDTSLYPGIKRRVKGSKIISK